MGSVLMVVLSALATVCRRPRAEGGSAHTPEVIKPEWFFYVAFRWLKLFSGTAAVLSMGFVVFTIFALALHRRTDP
jgi:quinol-cytochrome oxidoreductase complex cytochrome b subunit